MTGAEDALSQPLESHEGLLRDCHGFASMLQYGICEERAIVLLQVLLQVLLHVPRCDGREAREEARTAKRKGRTEKRMKREWYITYHDNLCMKREWYITYACRCENGGTEN
jgi:hypothetical protein